MAEIEGERMRDGERSRRGIRKTNDRGMSLVEIIIAVAILTIALIPILSTFVTSLRYNAKARQLQRATDLAQTVIESLKAPKMTKDKLDAATGDQAFTQGSLLSGWSVEDSSTAYSVVTVGNTTTYRMTGVYNPDWDEETHAEASDSGRGGTYDVEVSMTPVSGSEVRVSSAIAIDSGAQASTVLNADTMSADASAVFTAKSAEELYKADAEALEFALDLIAQYAYEMKKNDLTEDELYILSGNVDYRWVELQRTFTLNLTDEANPSMNVEYKITKWDTPKTPDDNSPALSAFSADSAVLSSILVETDAGMEAACDASGVLNCGKSFELIGTPTDSVYIYYYPRYSGWLSTTRDVQGMFASDQFRIHVAQTSTSDTAALHIYLYKQINHTVFDSLLGDLNTEDGQYYKPRVIVDTTGRPVYVNTNLNRNLYDNTSTGWSTSGYFNSDPSDPYYTSDARVFLADGATSGLTIGDVSTPSVQSYSIVVRVYRSDDPLHENLLVEMDGSFLNW